ncbi:Uip5p KNAG_0C01360 [Huiozyma naganishii CBS 8797]|uniref:L-type lectin-like domain-containing protein n=1 Tax=Huiozyma naganishii (strain ATCC MYA-139 / BCRC 22969 / CBS 8797 / KCTC 17520 / NBRC 10181 / NCYC 3082 / Yp74L-3) TaxID=1071383 RepID=J7S4E1_HUIN7|nr:hypothetical protein KNAG_0C01360 [Kazachstania naganishii CBS 8797]CCK69249.1 hypothetical protein KNAG_0C01360 [Kazachstania naganishii CBS 8797]
MEGVRWRRVFVAVGIGLLFVLCHQRAGGERGHRVVAGRADPASVVAFDATVGGPARRSRIVRVPNGDASLAVPLLDKMNRFWHAAGTAEIRNFDSVRLTSAKKPNTYGTLLSNGIGDNEINDFEVEFEFRIDQRAGDTHVGLSGDGVSFVVTSENKFMLRDLTSSFAMRQYVINSGGIMAGDHGLMGFPRNLPCLAVVVDTYANVQGSTVPFADVYVNRVPERHWYDLESDGARSTGEKLNDHKIPLPPRIAHGQRAALRIIYMESISFLKIDLRVPETGDYWVELFQAYLTGVIPKNADTGQRFIGMGSLTGELSETVELFSIKTNEFHWETLDETMESSVDYYREAHLFLQKEFGQRVALESDEFTRWKMIKSQPHYNLQQEQLQQQQTHRLWLWVPLSACMLTVFYLISVYIRVSQKHLQRLRLRGRTRRVASTLLPI